MEQLINFGETQLALAITDSQTSITVVNGSIYPTEGIYRLQINNELLIAQSRSGNVITVERGGEGTQAVAHDAATVVKAVLSRQGLLNAIEENSGGVPDLADVATSGDYNDLSNKPTIPTATSDLTNDSGFITAGDIPAIPTAISELENDADFVQLDSNLNFGIVLGGSSSNRIVDSGFSFPLDASDETQIINVVNHYRGEVEVSQSYVAGDIVKESTLTAICIADISVSSVADFPSSQPSNWRILAFADKTSNILKGDGSGNAVDSGISFPLDASDSNQITNFQNYFNQSLNTTDSPTFNNLTATSLTGELSVSGTSNGIMYNAGTIASVDSAATVDGSGNLVCTSLVAAGFVYPTADGSDGQVLKTDGAGGLTFGGVPSPFDQSLNTTDTPTFGGLTVAGMTFPTSLGTAGQHIGSNGAGLTWLDYPNIPSIAETTNILVGDDNGNASDSGFSFPLDATDTAQIANAYVNDQSLNTYDNAVFNSVDLSGDGLSITESTILKYDETWGLQIDPVVADENIRFCHNRTGAVYFGDSAAISYNGTMSGFGTYAVDGSGVYNLPVGGVVGDFLQRIVDDAAMPDGEYKIVVSSGVASLVAI